MVCYRIASVFLVLLVSSNNGASDDAAILDGKWDIIRVEVDGRPVDARGHYYEFKNGRVLLHGRIGADDIGAFAIDAKAEPKRLDVKIDNGINKGMASLGIFLVKGNLLTICQARPPCLRPNEFVSTDESSLIFLERSRKDGQKPKR